jgi:hypothetical protein
VCYNISTEGEIIPTEYIRKEDLTMFDFANLETFDYFEYLAVLDEANEKEDN